MYHINYQKHWHVLKNYFPLPFSSPGRMGRVVCDIEISILDFLHNSTPAGNLFVGSVLESSCTGVYTLVLRSDPPPTFLAGASSARSLFSGLTQNFVFWVGTALQTLLASSFICL